MAELTIQIPDELAQRLEPLQNRLPELLWRLLDIDHLLSTSQPKTQAETTDITAVYQEVLDFLIKRPTPEEIITFKVSLPVQKRLQELLEKNRSATISTMEFAELDVYEQLEHMMILLKARAYTELNK
ncbi:hypothetical protein G7B40_018025 [Aetokthonos hydrillicola Thurmond2011]|jgi:predicted transcriptional regulator|uniref:Uncharacterized protein n=1 Tax=Aetokthonos hydrillicola Thurmond2011 TaxID=2712845 RepID=A0AAP5IB28_9CYAN|nr:hypothetical protein [Aetokthonos hydrillicola]MBO3460398.1 hypothetical protein [Aetokthonos hydrillicola CCALA 1050]MBW4584480.1 hypothetical protein [Aetokthonos hydrillicola CCALA 1050]MDR9896443.1 hypothetical protein [Aetokthonos hydrillicola Thurmond2011]